MNDKKAVFFDVDGTIWDYHNVLPDSTREAFRLLRANGHLTFINSGRSKAYLFNPLLDELGFDGCISGCGTRIDFRGENLYYHEIDNALMAETVRIVRDCGMKPVLEGVDNLYMSDAEFAGDSYGNKLKRELGTKLLDIDSCWGSWKVSKLACATEDADIDKCISLLSDHYDFIVHHIPVIEIVPKGRCKGAAILDICRMLGIRQENTYSIGDSNNDTDMILTAGHGIAMGNASDELKSAADFVTTDLMDDGIFNAFRHYGLI